MAEIVLGCSDSIGDDKAPWRQRKEQYLAHLVGASQSIQLVSACDKLYNARTIVTDLRRSGPSVWSRFKAGREGSIWYYRALTEIFEQGGSPVAPDLRAVVDSLTTA